MPLSSLPKITDDWSAGAGGFFQSRALSDARVAHGVSTRALGNMKDPARRKAALEGAGVSAAPLFLKQVHGTKIWEAGRGAGDAPEGDGWISRDAAFAPCVYAADCLPIFIWDREDRSAVGVFHAGWRGLAEGMPRAAVKAFEKIGLDARSLAAAVGPHIGSCCYEVAAEVAGRFRPEIWVRSAESERVRLDLGLEAFFQLTECGVGAENITVSSACTSTRNDEFFSFRREKMDQRMMAFIQKP